MDHWEQKQKIYQQLLLLFNDASNIIHLFISSIIYPALFSFPTRNKNEKAFGLKWIRLKHLQRLITLFFQGWCSLKQRCVLHSFVLYIHRLYTPTFVGTYIVNQAYGVRCCASVSNMYASWDTETIYDTRNGTCFGSKTLVIQTCV